MLNISIGMVTYCPDFSLLDKVYVSLNDAISCLSGSQPCFVTLSVIDNSLEQTTFERIKALAECRLEVSDSFQVRYIQAEANIGYGRANNLAIQQAASDFHLVLNPDVVLALDTLLTAVSYLQRHPDVGLLSPKVFGFDGKQQFIAKAYPNLLTLLLRLVNNSWLNKHFKNRLNGYELRHLIQGDEVALIPIAGGCFMLFRTELIKRIGGFDPGYFLYFEDFQLSIDTGKLTKIAYVPSVTIRHDGGQAGKKGLRHIFLFMRSAIYFFNKNGWRLW